MPKNDGRFNPAAVVRRHLWAMRPDEADRMTTRDRWVYAATPLVGGSLAGVAVWLGVDVAASNAAVTA